MMSHQFSDSLNANVCRFMQWM